MAILGSIAFSFKAILIKIAYAVNSVDPVVLLGLRMFYSAPFYLAIGWWLSRTGPPIAPRDRWAIIWLGFIGYYLSSLLDFIGLQYISAALERLVLFLYPTLVVLLSALFYKKPITRPVVGALALSYVGIAFVFWHDGSVTGSVERVALGSAVVFAGALLYATYLVFATTVIQRVGSARFTAWAMLASAGFIGAHALATQPAAALAQPMKIHAIGLAMAVFSTVLPSFLMSEALSRIGANSTSVLGAVGPVTTLAFGALLLSEPIGALQIFGAVLVLTGVLLITVRRR